jgi:hypothetical protein
LLLSAFRIFRRPNRRSRELRATNAYLFTHHDGPPMNILVPHGFEANYTVGFAKGLAANGVPLCVLASNDTAGCLSAAGIPNANLQGRKSEAPGALEKAANLSMYYWRLLSFLARHRGGTIHFTGVFKNNLILFEGILINACFKILSGRYVYTAHNVLPHNREQSRFFRWIYRFAYKTSFPTS